jgi:hypothetical protein
MTTLPALDLTTATPVAQELLRSVTSSALSGSAAAGKLGVPMLLVDTTSIPTATRALMATGTTIADALAGGPVAAGIPGPVLLSQPTCRPTETGQELTRLDIDSYTLLGGTGALSANVAALYPCAVNAAPVTPPPPPTATLTCKASVSNPTPRSSPPCP